MIELEITQEKENGLFDRIEVSGILKSEVAPKREDVLKVLAEKFSVPQETIKINGIYGRFGLQEFKLEASIYNSKEEKDKLEIKKKKEIEAEKKQAESEKVEAVSDQPAQDHTPAEVVAPEAEQPVETPDESLKEESKLVEEESTTTPTPQEAVNDNSDKGNEAKEESKEKKTEEESEGKSDQPDQEKSEDKAEEEIKEEPKQNDV